MPQSPLRLCHLTGKLISKKGKFWRGEIMSFTNRFQDVLLHDLLELTMILDIQPNMEFE